MDHFQAAHTVSPKGTWFRSALTDEFEVLISLYFLAYLLKSSN